MSESVVRRAGLNIRFRAEHELTIANCIDLPAACDTLADVIFVTCPGRIETGVGAAPV